MLEVLKIKNFALIADQTIEFGAGFNVLIGETGAGKSLILDALSFVLGEKANKLNIRHGQEKMTVQAVFSLNRLVETFLNENDIDVEDQLIVSRSLNVDGKSDCRINGQIVAVATLKSMGELLLDTYAQNENIELLKVKNHLFILDSYSGLEVANLKLQVIELLDKIKQINLKMQELGGDCEGRERELEFLSYQIEEIENANLKPNEDIEIKQEIDRLSNFEKIFENVSLCVTNLSGIDEKLFDAIRALSLVEKYDENITEYINRLTSAKLEISDMLDVLKNQNQDDYDQNLMDVLNKRYDEIKVLKKKYGSTIQDILVYLDKIKQQQDNLLFSEEKLNNLEKEKNILRQELYDACVELSNKRKSSAIEIENKVLTELALLGFNNCKFKICFKDLCNFEDAIFTKNGLDDVEFLFSANAGEELKSLSKTISGGEMSRFMLAIKNVFAGCFETSTLVFDEVDTGISGEIGQKVAERLAMLSKNYQLICITHLCQVTAMADKYIHVKKEVVDDNTYTTVSYLFGDDIIKYIAIASGAQPTDVALRFAEQLKTQAENFKKTNW